MKFFWSESRRIFLLSGLLVTGTALTDPAAAATFYGAGVPSLDSPSLRADLANVYNRFYHQVQQSVQSAIGIEVPDAIVPIVQNAMQDSLGALGLPDPDQVRAQLDQGNAIPLPNGARFDPILDGPELARELERQTARAWAGHHLGQSGQQATVEAFQRTQAQVGQAESALVQTRQAPSTQATLKAMAAHQMAQTELLAELRVESLQSRTDTQINNLLLGQVSELLEQQQRVRSLDRHVNAWENIRMSSFQLF